MEHLASVTPTQDPDNLPHYLVVKFDPTDQPSGVVDFQDLAQLVRGLEDIIVGILVTDAEEADNTSQERGDLTKSLQFTAFAASGGSYEIVITLRQILNFMVRVTGIDTSKPLDPQELLRLFTATTNAGANQQVVSQAGEDLYNDGRRQLARLLAFLRDLRASHLDTIAKYADSEARVGVRNLLKVARRPGNIARPPTIGSDQTKLKPTDPVDPIPLDSPFETGADRFMRKPVPGPAVVAVGAIKSWVSAGPHFRLKTKKFRTTLKCKCAKNLDQTVRSLIGGNNAAYVTGTAYYLDGVTPQPPPLFIRVQAVREARGTEAFDIGYEESGSTPVGSPPSPRGLWPATTP